MIQHKIKMEMNMVNKLKRVSSVLATVLIVVFAFSSCTKKSACGEIDGYYREGIFEYYDNGVPLGYNYYDEGGHHYIALEQGVKAVMIFGEGERADTIGLYTNSVPLSYRKPGISIKAAVTYTLPHYITIPEIKAYKLLCIEKIK